jgi:hypothetical protein
MDREEGRRGEERRGEERRGEVISGKHLPLDLTLCPYTPHVCPIHSFIHPLIPSRNKLNKQIEQDRTGQDKTYDTFHITTEYHDNTLTTL